jgi:hypothetical protein
MVWAPSPGYDYPNIGQPIEQPIDPDVLAALNVPGNNIVGPEDDPYEPFYPGDEYVDWVGLSTNWAPDLGTGNPNARVGPPPAGYFVGCIDGNQDFLNQMNSLATFDQNFYARFAEGKNKPMILR